MAAEVVVSYVRNLIESGEYTPGDRLPAERSLAGEIGVSRPSVRAGLQSLAAMGVVEIRHGSGNYVSEGPPLLTSKPLDLFASVHGISEDEMFEARRVLEIDVAGLAAERATAEQLAAISHEVLEMFGSEKDPQRFLVHDIQFHRAIAQAAGNPVLAALVDMVADLFYEQRKKSVYRARGVAEAAVHHRRIYRAIRAHDRKQARAEMDAHLRWAEEVQTAEATATDDAADSGNQRGDG
jgi:GntR family transcriptional repressor for pyruvate dehydrogenase complex